MKRGFQMAFSTAQFETAECYFDLFDALSNEPSDKEKKDEYAKKTVEWFLLAAKNNDPLACSSSSYSDKKQ